MTNKFFTKLNKIDHLLSSKPTVDNYNLLKSLISEDASIKYFYENIQEPKWVEILFNQGEFNNPLDPVPETKKEISIMPFWPPSQLLTRIAEKDANLIYNIIIQIPDTDNERIHEDFIKAACSMPHDLAANLAKKEAKWIESKENIFFSLPELAAELIIKLAKENEIEAALELAKSLFQILPEIKDIPEGIDDKFKRVLTSQEPKARFESWQYEDVLKKCFPDLVSVAKLDALKLICEQLENAIRIRNGGRGRNEDVEDYSYIWRPAIEDNEQNRSEDLMGILVTAVRDCADSLMETDGEAVLQFIESRSFKIFRRIELYLRRKWPDIDKEGINQIITDQSIVFDSDFEHELFHLIREQFPRLSSNLKSEYLNIIDKGIDLDHWIKLSEEAGNKKPNNEEIEREKRRRQYKALLPIQSYLEGKWIQKLGKLKAEFGEVDHPDFGFYSTTWVGPATPKSANDLLSMNDDDLIAYIKGWKPEEKPFPESKEGLSRTLSTCAKEDPVRFASIAERFKELEPPYVSGMLSGLRDAIRDEKTFEWSSILQLCLWIVSQDREIPGYQGEYGENGWGWTRRRIADLIENGLMGEGIEIPFKYKEIVWKIIEPLTDDPEPDEKYEKQYGGTNMDPVTLSINTVRGEAMHALIQYALWIRREMDKSENVEERIKKGFQEMPEVREVLDKRLKDSTLTIRSVYGKWFPWLVLLDSEWSKKNISTIFPHDKDLIPYFDAAWDAYIIFCKPNKNILSYLIGEYQFAIENIQHKKIRPKTVFNPEQNLAEHLMIYYWHGELKLGSDDNLISQLFAKAPVNLRGYALAFIGRILDNAKTPIEQNVIERLKKLWQWRITIILISENSEEYSEEFSQFTWWFTSGKFDDEWAISQLHAVLKLNAKIDRRFKKVVEKFVELLDQYPYKIIECFGLIIANLQNRMTIYLLINETKILLKKSLENEKIHSRAEDIVHRLGAMGFLEFRDLLKGG